MGNAEKAHFFIVGAKCIGQYGGYETFVMEFLEFSQPNKQIQFHVAYNGDGYMNIDKLLGARKTSENEFEYCRFKRML